MGLGEMRRGGEIVPFVIQTLKALVAVALPVGFLLHQAQIRFAVERHKQPTGPMRTLIS